MPSKMPFSDLVAGSLRPPDPESVAAAARALDGPVLWSGPRYAAQAVTASADHVVLCLLMALAILPFLAATLAGRSVWRDATGARTFAPRGGFLPVSGALIGAAYVGVNLYADARRDVGQGVVIARDAVSVVERNGTRTDLPATAVRSIRRERSGGATLTLAGYGRVEVVPAPERVEALDRALAGLGWRRAAR